MPGGQDDLRNRGRGYLPASSRFPVPVPLPPEPLATIVAFIESVGIPVAFSPLDAPTFLPGVRIERGTLRVDPDRLAHPGDLLHEAGHLAVVAPEVRATLDGDVGAGGPGEEMAAIAWSWAALTHLGLAPDVVFHPDGYHGTSDSIVENFRAGRYFGVPLLQWMELTHGPERAADLGAAPFPAMQRWLRA